MSTATRERLIDAARALLTAGEVPPTMENVARTADVSRATAYRAVSGVPEILQAVTERALERHRNTVADLVSRERDAVAKIEATVVYTVTEVRADEALAHLIPSTGLAGHDFLRGMGFAFVDPILRVGQDNGEIRADIGTGTITDWILDCYVGGTSYRTFTAKEARTLFRTFFAPALRPARSPVAGELAEAEQGLREALVAVRKIRRSTRS
ncbi:MAG TPA: hypothetical protein VGJ14_09220 [Sporichthyaceae bacterium]|jgi:AcrR family transcriptional regulator